MTSRSATSQPGPKHSRGAISIDGAVRDEFSLQAVRAGKTARALANEWLAAASKISAEGGTAAEILEGWYVSRICRDLEAIPLPADLVGGMVERLCELDKGKALELFCDLGDNLSRLLRIYAPDVEQLAALARGFTRISPLKRLDIERTESSIILSIVGAGRKLEVTECAFEFVKSLLDGYGYPVSARDLGVGTIRVVAKRQGLAAPERPMRVPTRRNAHRDANV